MTSRRLLAGTFAVAALLVVTSAYSVNIAAQQGTYATPSKETNPQACVSQPVDSAKELFVNRNPIWSGTRQELEAVARNLADTNNPNGYAFENTTHLGRNATMLVPATLSEMEWEINSAGNPAQWKKTGLDGYHHPDANADCNIFCAAYWSFFDTIEKYVNPSGGEAVYDKKTLKIVTDFHLGTKNYGGNLLESHPILDIFPHGGDVDYKYVGILYVHNTSGMYHIVDGQSGKYMSRRQVAEFPTTMSDMWKNRGPACVASDMLDLSEVSAFFISGLEFKVAYMRELQRKKVGPIGDSDLKTLNENTKKMADMALAIDNALAYFQVKEGIKKAVWETILRPVRMNPLMAEHDQLLKSLGLPSIPILSPSAGIIKYSN